MFTWLGNALMSILKTVLYPITHWFYQELIVWPLTVLHYINASFLYLSGEGVDKLLFNTSFSGGHVKANFFNNPSPIQKYYLITFAIAGALSGIFVALAAAKTIVSRKQQQQNGALVAATRVTGGLFGITLIPIVTLAFLSLVSSLSAVFSNGKNLGPSNSDVSAKSVLQSRIDKVNQFVGRSELQTTSSPNNIYVDGLDIDSSTKTFTKTPRSFDLLNHNSFADLQKVKPITVDGKAWNISNGVFTSDQNTKIDNFVKYVNSKSSSSSSPMSVANPIFKQLALNSTPGETYFNLLKELQEVVVPDSPTSGQIQDQNFATELNNLITQYQGIFSSKDSSTSMFYYNQHQLLMNKGYAEALDNSYNTINKISASKNQSASDSLAAAGATINEKFWNLVDFINKNDSFMEEFSSQYSTDPGTIAHDFIDTVSKGLPTDVEVERAAGLYKTAVLLKNIEISQQRLGLDTQLQNASGSTPVVPNNFTRVNELAAQLNNILNGDGKTYLTAKIPMSIDGYAQKTSEFETGAVVLAFYHLASGQPQYDTHWNQTPHHIQSTRILIGFFAILGAIGLMAGIVMFVAKRIFDIALLFVISPIFVVWSSVDDGKRLTQWFNLFLSKILSILAIVIGARLLDLVLTSFQTQIDIAQPNHLSSLGITTSGEDTFYEILMALMAFGGLQFLKTGTITIATLFGGAAGLDAISGMMQSFGTVRKMAKGTRKFAKGIATGGSSMVLGATMGRGASKAYRAESKEGAGDGGTLGGAIYGKARKALTGAETGNYKKYYGSKANSAQNKANIGKSISSTKTKQAKLNDQKFKNDVAWNGPNYDKAKKYSGKSSKLNDKAESASLHADTYQSKANKFSDKINKKK